MYIQIETYVSTTTKNILAQCDMYIKTFYQQTKVKEEIIIPDSTLILCFP